ncbi:MAG: substrate-binding domain-containing protein [Reyranella sp.]|uniref:substrate-binding domain-containing protein n=1 Tax=Reyranella sp. TaxID=1929291 RepID=UPI003D0E13C5
MDCSTASLLGVPREVPYAVLHERPPARGRGSSAKLRIAHFIGLTGTAGIWGPSAVNSALLAATEINARGGILGREIELSVHDTGAPLTDLESEARDLVELDDADLVLGAHTSAVRVALRDIFSGRVPYIYTPIYEGGERTPGVLAIGETPPRQARPAIAWLAERKRAERWYLIGSDYVWPWLSHRSVKRYIAEAGGQVVGEDFVALGEQDHDGYLARIEAARPDVVFISLIGLDGILFNRSFAEHGLSGRMLRLANCVDETVLLGIGADKTENLYAASGYFVDPANAGGEAFREAYHRVFGACAPVPGATAQSSYEGLCCLEALARRAGSLDARALAAAAEGAVYHGGRGPVGLHRQRAEMPIYLGEAQGFDFRVMAKF